MDQKVEYAVRPLGERVSVLETQQVATDEKLDEVVRVQQEIKNKLDELLELKQKGMGAFSFISILFASATGVGTLIALILGFFMGKH